MRTTLLAPLWVALMIAVASANVACSGGSGAETATAEGSSTPPVSAVSPPQVVVAPTATATPAPVLRTTGSLIFLRGTDLWVAALDGTNERQLTRGSLGAGYAGATRDPYDGHRSLYFTSELANADTPDPQRGYKFQVLKQRLDGSDATELFTFEGGAKQHEYSATDASVSPDGRYVAYSDGQGISIYDTALATSSRVLTDVGCTDRSPENCRGYFNPAWSPRGDWLMVEEIFYEGATFVGIRPPEPDTVREFVPKYRYGAAAWSPDGAAICFVPFNSLGAAVVVNVDPGVPAAPDLERALRSASPSTDAGQLLASSCTWSATGRLAMGYSLADDRLAERLAVFDGSRLDEDLALPATAMPRANAVTWLPDGSGVLVTYGEREGAPAITQAVLLDGTTRTLPFAAERVLGVIQ